jgi:hypothetical protein
MLLLRKSKKANSRSASRVGTAIKLISSLWQRSRAWFATETPLTPTICDSRSPARWDARSSVEFTVPLCRTHHRDNHRFGNEQAWWATASIDPLEVSRKLWVSTRRIE